MKEKELNWILNVLDATKENSTCYKYKIGAIIVKDGRIISTGWNGTPRDILECKEYYAISLFFYYLKDYISKKILYKIDLFSNKYFENYGDFVYDFKHELELNEIDFISYVKNLRINDEYSFELDDLKYEIIDIYSKYENNKKFDFLKLFFNIAKNIENIDNKSDIDNPYHSRYEIHAEMNAIAFAARNGISLENSELVCNYLPCLECAKIIVQSGIKKVYYLKNYIDKRFNESSENFLKMSGVEVIKI